ncbi:hypothetical protein ASE63_06320 [Bosea sp. Root381]|uniref:hypothetical protein n=1 Tax=Bosea sp. Root381 TaxID=1736524 RepID=UPI0006F37284|nr:hypothetical protein [Bosea sp. Root381]KRE05925.1 hypothetical protein ASE63_06320 [Bosea sp. Root381]
MKPGCVAKSLSVLVFAVAAAALSSPAEAFWQRSQVSHCADATTPAERARHRCEELRAYADPGWPVVGVGEMGFYGVRKYRAPASAYPPAGRAPVRRLG